MTQYMNGQGNPTGFYRGDIYYVSKGVSYGSEQEAGRPAIIVSNDIANKYSPNVLVVYLTSQEKKPLPSHVPISCKVPSVALCENVACVSKERLGNFMKFCTAGEMAKVDEALAYALGLDFSGEAKPVEAKPVTTPSEDMLKLAIERDMYKNMYETLLDKLVRA